MFKFIPNKLALIVLLSACTIILISMGLRQTFGLFFKAFEEGLGLHKNRVWPCDWYTNVILGNICSIIWLFSR